MRSLHTLTSNNIIRNILGFVANIAVLYIIMLIIIVSLMACAKLEIYSFDEQIKVSDAIIIGKVKGIEKNFFQRDVAFIEPIKTIKGNIKDKVIRIRYGKSLFFTVEEDSTKFIIGESYLLFLFNDGIFYRLVGADQGYYHVKKTEMIYTGCETIQLKDVIDRINKEIKKTRNLTVP